MTQLYKQIENARFLKFAAFDKRLYPKPSANFDREPSARRNQAGVVKPSKSESQ
jgi:hypothetical protein